MSVQVYIDESSIIDPKRKQSVATLAGIALPAISVDEFNRRLWKLKSRFFKTEKFTDYPLKGRLLLNNRAFESYRKLEFVQELFSLCRFMKVKLFANTAITDGTRKPTGDTLRFEDDTAAKADSMGCPLILADLMEKVSSFMLEEHPGQLATLVFSQEEGIDILKQLQAIMQLHYFSPLGRGLDGILGSPLTAHPTLTPALQLANVAAYIVSQHHNGRAQMREHYRELQGLQYVSEFSKDDFELRGMNSFRMD